MYSFSYLEPVHCSMSSSNCCFVTCIQISQEADKALPKARLAILGSWLPQQWQLGGIWGPGPQGATNWAIRDTDYYIENRYSMWTENFQMFKLDLEKAEEPEIKLPTSLGSLKKQESSRKTSTSALLTMPKPLTVWITTNCGKFWKGW